MNVRRGYETFLIGIKTEVGSKETLAWYRKRLGRLVEFLGDRELETVGLDDLRAFVSVLQDQDVKWSHHHFHKPVPGRLSVSTIHGYVRAVKKFYNWMMENGYIDLAHNAAIRLKKPKLPRHEPKAISDEDLVSMLRTAHGWGRYATRNFAMLVFMAETGCRVGGLVELRLGDVDLENGRALVTEKGDKTRAVFFGGEVKAALTAWLSDRAADGDFVFVGERGRLTCNGVRLLLRRLARAAGVKGRVNPHSFRHAFARRHLLNGGDIGILSDLMGHSDIKVTKEAYSIFTTSELQRKHREYSTLDKMLDT